jgi:hypothetical protein
MIGTFLYRCALVAALISFATPFARAQDVSPSPSPAAGATPTASASPAATMPAAHPKASFTFPKGWVRAPGDSVAMEWRAPSGMQSIRIAPARISPDFEGAHAIETVKAMIAHFPFPQTDVTNTTICKGTEPAVLAIAKGSDGKIVMESIVAQGPASAAIVTYGIPDGSPPDPAAEAALHTLCLP